MGFGDDTVENSVGYGGFGDVVVPLGYGELADGDGTGAFVAVFEDLE